MQYVRAQFKKTRYYQPGWLEVICLAYHKYGLKYLALLIVLVAYSFMGAGVFIFFEKPAELERESRRLRTFEDLRESLIRQMVDNLYNDSEKALIFMDAAQMEAISSSFETGLRTFENAVTEYNSRQSLVEPLLKWDLWTALIYSWTVITTIGYGHLFPLTVGGRIATMLYAVVGIPLMLTVLSNIGKLLTKAMKYPFFIVKRIGRRMFRYCTKMTKKQILDADEKDKSTLEVFDLPIPVAIVLVIAWIFFCSAITLIWEKDWNYLVAFYFFFISLSTIGFGDVVPSRPYYLLLLFGNIIIGMALLSMLLNLIQGKLAPITTDEDEVDPFDLERNGLKKALGKSPIFQNLPWMTEQTGMVSSGAATLSKTTEIAMVVNVDAKRRASSDRRRSSAGARRKSKQAAGGAAVSALSAFLAPLFSNFTDEKRCEKDAETGKETNEMEVQPIEQNQDEKIPEQLVIMDETMQSDTSSKADQDHGFNDPRFRPLKKTVSFQENELLSVLQNDQQITRKNGNTEPPVVLATKSNAPIRALAMFDSENASVSSVRLRRMETVERPKKRKKRRHLRATASLDTNETDGAMDDDDRRSTPRRKKRQPKHDPMISHPIPRIPQMTAEISQARPREYFRRANTTPETTLDHLPIIGNVHESHSACSICAYQPLADANFANQVAPYDTIKPFGGPDLGGNPDLITFEYLQPERPHMVPTHQPLAYQLYFDRPLQSYTPCEMPQMRAHRPMEFPWYRHSISTDVTHDFNRPHPVMIPQSNSEQRCTFANIEMLKHMETQTMISFPSQDSDSRVSISGERGTARLLPESVSFTEINRLVELNINAEILRNELAALAMAETSAGDLRAYEHVLSLQDLIDQINHEASLPRF